MATESKRQTSGAVEERLIYYADFYDLKTILKKHWSGEFSAAFGEWKTTEVWLDELEKLRDPDAHQRELLPHQKHLGLGIAGEIRTRLVRYRSKQETSEDYFPRIESVRDNYGNIWTASGSGLQSVPVCITKIILRQGDLLEYVVTASDPKGDPLEFRTRIVNENSPWVKENSLAVQITERHISKMFSIQVQIRSPRQYHANNEHDDSVMFVYQVLPPRPK